MQESAYISSVQPVAFAFIAGAEDVAITVKLLAVPETWAAESQQNWPVGPRTHLHIFFDFSCTAFGPDFFILLLSAAENTELLRIILTANPT